jgi:hypothetical protein
MVAKWMKIREGSGRGNAAWHLLASLRPSLFSWLGSKSKVGFQLISFFAHLSALASTTAKLSELIANLGGGVGAIFELAGFTFCDNEIPILSMPLVL